jgi:hypothetical protein
MSLFKSAKKYEMESKQSVVVKQKLDAHLKTYPAARAAYENMRSAVICLTGEVATLLAAEGHSRHWRDADMQLRAATLARDKPLVDYASRKNNLELELLRLVYRFVFEQDQQWQDETDKIKSEEIFRVREESDKKDNVFAETRYFQIDNREAVRFFRKKSLENLLHLRSMIHDSIPAIEQFIQDAETEMREINLAAREIEISREEFRERSMESFKGPGKIETGYVAKDTIIVPRDPEGRVDTADCIMKEGKDLVTEMKYLIAKQKQ